MSHLMLNESKTGLTENGTKRVEELLESFKDNTLEVENAETLLVKAGAVDFQDQDMMESYLHMASLQDKFLNENNTTADLLTYQKKIQPLLRRVIPSLLAMDIASVQPVDTPDSRVFALKANYAGSTDEAISRASKIFDISSATGAIAVGAVVTGATGVGTVEYTEAGNLVVLVSSGVFVEGETITDDTPTTPLTATLDAIYSTEVAYKKILKGYSGALATNVAEGTDANQVAVLIESISVTAKERLLKSAFTTELVQDMKNVFGANAEQEIMNYLATELMLELDREIIDGYKDLAVVSPELVVASSDEYQVSGTPQLTAISTRILKASNDIAKRNRRGKGNIVVATGSIITALEEMGKFKNFGYDHSVKHADSSAKVYVGTLKSGQKVYQDWFATNEYAMVIYKGVDKFDAGLVYSPYIPLWFDRATDVKTMQPVVGAKMRYAITPNTLIGGNGYAEIFTVNFAGTVFE